VKKLILAIAACSLAMSSVINVAQEMGPSRPPDIIRISTGYEIWRYDQEKMEFIKIWENLPLFVDRVYRNEWWRKGLFSNLSAMLSLPAIADIDNDGENELIAGDSCGIVIYGKNPLYFPYEKVMMGPYQILVADVDNDGNREIVTQRMSSFDRSSEFILEIWKIESNVLRKIFEKQLWNNQYVLQFEDVNNDGEKELITAGDSILILKRKDSRDWEIMAELPNIGLNNEFTMIDAVSVADVDFDGKNEILATGNSGLLTIYKHRKQKETEREIYPVLWQSPPLASEDANPKFPNTPRPPSVMCFTQGLGVGDLDNDGNNEICVGTMEGGGGKIHIFKYKREKEFCELWVSGWTDSSRIPAFTVGDVDGDRKIEFIHNGQTIYGYDSSRSEYFLKKSFPEDGNFRGSILGRMGSLEEPSSSLRIVPVKWTLPNPAQYGSTYYVTLTLRNVWARADDITITLKSEEKFISIKDEIQKIKGIERGGFADSPPFTIEILKPDPVPEKSYGGVAFLDILATIEAKGGYKQSVPLTVTVQLPNDKSSPMSGLR
jgi:hypothetical protein